MKKFLLATAMVSLSTTAFADVTNATVRDVYRTKIVHTPTTEKQCRVVSVPIYETFKRSGTAGEAITGGVIGGVIGNQFGNGSGKDAMTILGVIIGANAADKKETVITGYREEKQCDYVTTYTDEKVKTYSHSIIEFTEDGKTRRVEFQK